MDVKNEIICSVWSYLQAMEELPGQAILLQLDGQRYALNLVDQTCTFTTISLLLTIDDVHLYWALQGYGMVEFSLASAALKCKQAMEAIENEMRPDSKKAGGKRKAGEAAPTEPQSQSAQVWLQWRVWGHCCHHSMLLHQQPLGIP